VINYARERERAGGGGDSIILESTSCRFLPPEVFMSSCREVKRCTQCLASNTDLICGTGSGGDTDDDDDVMAMIGLCTVWQ
jgi:hypothetical protein